MDENTLLKIQGSPLVRDAKSKAILNTSDIERQSYLARKSVLQSKDKRLDLLEQKVLKLEAQIEILIKLIQQ